MSVVLGLTVLAVLVLAVTWACSYMGADYRRLRVFQQQLETEQRMEALTRATLAEMRRIANEARRPQ